MTTVIAVGWGIGPGRARGAGQRDAARALWAVATAGALIAGCRSATPPQETWSTEVWVCHVPLDSSSPWYAGLSARRPVTAEWFADRVRARVPDYFDRVSGGRLSLEVAAGGELTLGVDEGAEECVARVVSGVEATTRAVVIVADAEHVEGRPGGLGGEMVRDPSAPVGVPAVGYAYVGAADVAPVWDDDPPMDLVEHELGHALGWHHSGSTGDAYDSALDVMSDSAAPRSVDPTRRDAPWPIAAQLMSSTWITPDECLLAEVERGGSMSTTLVPLSQGGGRRVVVLPVPGQPEGVITIEIRDPAGYDSHLPEHGLAVHRVEFRSPQQRATACGGDEGFDWTQVVSVVPLTGGTPFTLLLAEGESLDVDGWRIAAGAEGRVTVGLVSGA